MNSTYAEKLRDPRWQKKRLEVMQRDGFACRDCSRSDRTLNVHHCHYERGAPWETDRQFLLTLCEECHEIRGCLEDGAKRALALIMARMGNVPLQDEELVFFVSSLVAFANNPEVHIGVYDHDEICAMAQALAIAEANP